MYIKKANGIEIMLPLKNWKIFNSDVSRPIIDVILENRNLTPAHLEKFKLSDRLHDPFLLPDMKPAMERIIKAVKKGEKIAIFGDYDVDGIVSTVLMVKLFEIMGTSVSYYLPSRQKDGYGLRPKSIDRVLQDGIQLLITVDNGITSNEAAEYARSKGLDLIITDHHLQEGELPLALAVVNPNRRDSGYPFKGLCGAGVVYKLFHAIAAKVLPEDSFKNFMLMHLDLVALATIADVAPITDENYALLKYGLKSLSVTRRPGLVELKRVSGLLGKEMNPVTVGYYLAPRLNAAGRLKDADTGVKLLLSSTREQAEIYARELNQLNSQRQKLQEEYLGEIIETIDPDLVTRQKILIVENADWETGLIGLISGRLKEKYSCPAMAFTKDESGNFVGSARSVDRFHITEALTQFKEMFINYGGHQKAAGVTIAPEIYPDFKREFISYVQEKLNSDDLVSDLEIDSVINAQYLNEAIVHMIREIGPFGEGNPEPVLMMENLVIDDMMPMSSGKHIKLFLKGINCRFESVWWGKGELKDTLKFGDNLDVAFKPELNNWNNRESLQLVIEDARYHDKH